MLKSLFSSKTVVVKKEYNFKSMYTFAQRQSEAIKIMEKHEDKIPVIIEIGTNGLPQLERSKLLIKKDLTIGQLIYKLRAQMKLQENEGIYLFVNNKYTPSTDKKLNDVYDKYADEDKYLYITLLKENVFG